MTVVGGVRPDRFRILLGMETTSLAATRIRQFLEQEPVVWLSTVRPDGRPHLVPIWFWWDGEALLVFSKPNAQKIRNLRERPSVMLALGDAEDDFDVGMIEGTAELLDQPTSEMLPDGHLIKYARQLAAIGLTPEEYAATYSQVLRIRPVRHLPWHGRTIPARAGGTVDRLDARVRTAIRLVALGRDRPELPPQLAFLGMSGPPDRFTAGDAASR